MLVEKIVNGASYTFHNESFSNSRNWGHKTKLYKNSNLIAENRCIYLNRTWESYQFQSCMSGCVYNLIDEAYAEAKEAYKEVNGIKRMTKKHLDLFQAELESNEDLRELNDLKKSLK